MLCPKHLVLASNNTKKIEEMNALFVQSGFDIKCAPQSEFGILDAQETAPSFVQNALIKAYQASRLSGLPALADDSGLCVDALEGAPGILSARFAGDCATDQDNTQKLLSVLEAKHAFPAPARFVCVLALVRHSIDPLPILCEGIWEGEIVQEPKGAHGFGYDPVFYLPNFKRTAAQMDPIAKNANSHRGRALHQLMRRLRGQW